MPSWAAGPVKAADCPIRMEVGVMPSCPRAAENAAQAQIAANSVRIRFILSLVVASPLEGRRRLSSLAPTPGEAIFGPGRGRGPRGGRCAAASAGAERDAAPEPRAKRVG